MATIDMRPLTIRPGGAAVQIVELHRHLDRHDISGRRAVYLSFCGITGYVQAVRPRAAEGWPDAKSKTFRYTAPFRKDCSKGGYGGGGLFPRPQLFIESRRLQLYKWVFENHHTVTNAKVWSNAAFVSNIPLSDRRGGVYDNEGRDRRLGVERETGSAAISFDAAFVEKGTSVPNSVCEHQPAPAPTAPKSKNNNRGKNGRTNSRRLN
jgi:hypothetical protein